MQSFRLVTLLVLSVCSKMVLSDAKEGDNRCITIEEFQNLKTEIQNLKDKVHELSKPVVKGDSMRNSYLKRLIMNNEVKVAFDANLNNNMAHAEVSRVIPYDHVITNIGNAYDKNTGVFQAPIAGTYLFSWTSTAAFGSSVHTRLQKNGHVIAVSHADSSFDTSTNHFEASSTKVTIITLQQGDRVYIQIIPGRGTLLSDPTEGHSGFAGTLLFV